MESEALITDTGSDNSASSIPGANSGWPWTMMTLAWQLDVPWPKITIVTPSFNQGKFLEQTIRSILNQGYPNLEYIIIDGGSSDNSVDIIRKYEKHLAYWVSEKDAGQYDAINKGFSHSTGEIMAWLNSDDMYCPWALHTVGEMFAAFPEVEWLSTLYPAVIDCKGHCIGFRNAPGFSRDAFLDGGYLPTGGPTFDFIQQESTFWRRSLWEKSGGLDGSIHLAADFDLWCSFYKHAELYGAGPLAFFRFQGQQKSLDVSGYFKEAACSLARLRSYFHQEPSVFRHTIAKWDIHKIPKIGGVLWSKYCYHGRIITLDDVRSNDPKWIVKKYKFFYR